jgi:NAD(P)-dependent dehydrogenase (short-subunit alcohol dehydrogenase family)
VRDIAAHLLGDDLNRLSRSRDEHSGEGPRPGESLPEFIHRINDEWVHATSRISPAVIVSLLETTTPEVLAFWASVELNFALFRPDLENPTEEDVRPVYRTLNALPVPYLDPDDISNAVLFLASDEGRFITGVALPVDAGYAVK